MPQLGIGRVKFVSMQHIEWGVERIDMFVHCPQKKILVYIVPENELNFECYIYL